MGNCCGAPVGFGDDFGAFEENDRLFADGEYTNKQDSCMDLTWHAPNYGDKKELNITIFPPEKKENPMFVISGLGLQWEVEQTVPIMNGEEATLCEIKVDQLGAPHLYLGDKKTLTIRKWPNNSFSFFTYGEDDDNEETTNCSYTLIEKGNKASFLKGNVKPSGGKEEIIKFATVEASKGFAAKEFAFQIGPNVDIRLVIAMFALKEYSKDQHRA